MNVLKKALKNSDFLKNFLTLMSGTVLAQVIPLALSPILTRIYSPVEFGEFGIFNQSLALCVILSTLAFDQAIIIEEKREASFNLLVGVLVIAVLFSFLVAVGLNFFKTEISHQLDLSESSWYYFLLPPAIFLLSTINLSQNWLNRNKMYKEISISKVSQSSVAYFT